MATATEARDQMDIVIVGHVDHGKSTVIGRLMADTGSLPDGKLEQVKAMCAANARPFEYAFLLDALKNEQAQGITIDTARCFFNSATRNYIIHDAPGHIEFLKNMVTGAARAEAALLVIDAEEGVQENSKRHGYMVSMLGVKQLAVLVNKMDLVDYSEEVFTRIKDEYAAFLNELGVFPTAFIPISARNGVNIVERSPEIPWFDGYSVLSQVDGFAKLRGEDKKLFRMPVQDIYKFTAGGDDRRIVAGTIATGTIKVGDDVMFYPSGKGTKIASIEGFSTEPRTEIEAGFATGFTLEQQIYIKAGELMVKKSERAPYVGRRFRANMFWMGRAPFVQGKQYKLKLGSTAVACELAEIRQVLDASELGTVLNKKQVDRHDVAEIVVETRRPIAFDLRNDLEATGRFVVVDEFEIAGCGIILEELGESGSLFQNEIAEREFTWERGLVTAEDRAGRFGHVGKLIVCHGVYGCGKRRLAKQLEKALFERGCRTYYFGISNYFEELDHDTRTRDMGREQHLERLGELARVMTDTGLLLITTVTDADDYDFEKLNMMSAPNSVFVINVGENNFSRFPVDVQLDYRPEMDGAIEAIVSELSAKDVLKK